MVNHIIGLVFCVWFLPFSYGISENENINAICSDDACYNVNLGPEIFSEASEKCVIRGGYLLSILNKEEAQTVYSLLWKFTNATAFTHSLKLWIGLQRKEKSCFKTDHALKGFSWITNTHDTKQGQFSNWLTEPRRTCVKDRCVSMKLQMDSPDNYKWSDELCSSQAKGYICKFTFQGMCQKVVLAGPGYVEYETPFGFKSSSLDLVPHNSSATVSCGSNRKHTGPLLICQKSDETNVYQWGTSQLDKKANRPFCASEQLGCKYNNGGCEHECVESPQDKSLSCRCREGYVLAPDLLSCINPDHCQSNPCEQKCINHKHGFKCSCSSGFVLADNQVNCNNIQRCLTGECDSRTINGYKNEELGSEHNGTASTIQRKNEHQQTTPRSNIDEQIVKVNAPKLTASTLMPSVKTVSSGVSSANDASDCNALRLRSKLLLSILCIGALFYC